MPSHRVTDAAHIAPYLTHAVSHHGQVTLVPPDNMGRVRQAKPKKNSKSQRQERNVKPEEDLKFNTGPRPLRNLLGNRGGKRPGRQDRFRDDSHGDEAYPDYPPPSFLEAMSTFPGPGCSNSATLVSASRPISPVTPSCHSSALHLPMSSSPSSNQHQPFPQPSHWGSTRDDIESDNSSLEIIDMESLQSQPEERLPSGIHLEEEVRRDWMNRRGVEFPMPAENQTRGRTKSRARVLSDSDVEDAAEEPQPDPEQELPKRRHMSLSPLRTFFPYRPMAVHDRAFSAHPTPSSSPYSSRSSLPFLSTTSLKMSLSTSSILSVAKGENFLTRKLLSLRGKERATSKESLDNWEVVESEPSTSTSMSECMGSPLSPPSQASPMQNQSHAWPMPAVLDHSITGTAPSVDQSTDASPHPLSLRDRKAPIVPFVKRPRQRAPPSPSFPVDLATIPQGPVLTSVRTRKPPPPPPPSKKKAQVISTSPLGHDSWRSSSIDLNPDTNTVLQRASATPLPSTPIDVHSARAVTSPPHPNAESVSVLACHPTTAVDIPLSDPPMGITCRGSNLDEIDTSGSTTTGDHLGQPSILVRAASLNQTSSGDDPSLNARRHYPGRPLPQPPGAIRASADSGATDSVPEDLLFGIGNQTGPHCPEGLLIDLEDNAVVQTPIGGSSSNWPTEEGHPMTTPSAASSSSSVDLLGSITDISVPPREASSEQPSTQRPSAATYLETTDLDVLVSRLGDDEGHQDGSNYDALLLLSEFMGPATPTSRSTPDITRFPPYTPPVPDDGLGASAPVPNVPLLATVQVQRRRTTKDGRVKLKLSLNDVPIDKCGICLTQFKSGDTAQSGSLCRHAFHETCLLKWLVRSKTCPMCRVPLVD
ncbi:hypothetical protein FPV67DRAFT_1105768 [Lyophyllum atratum]|nr:hypothetical protein FPV67DRAFT_1105768 [Lyophyllum atratum]